MPVRFRKRCLNAYAFRRERSQNLDNNNAHPNIYNQGLILPPLLLDEQWAYAAGNFPVTGVANWNVFNPVAPGNNLNRTDGVGDYITKNTSVSGFAVLSSSATIVQANVSKPLAARVILHSIEAGIGGGNPSTFTLGISNGANSWEFQLSIDTVSNLTWQTIAPGPVSHSGGPITNNPDTEFLILTNGTNQMKFYINGVLTDTITNATPPLSGLVAFQIIQNTAGVANATNQSLGRLRLYGSNV